MDSYYPAEDYYERNVVSFIWNILIRYNYQLPLILLWIAGLIIDACSTVERSVLTIISDHSFFIWLCTFDVRRVQELLPLHPFIGLWAGIVLDSYLEGSS